MYKQQPLFDFLNFSLVFFFIFIILDYVCVYPTASSPINLDSSSAICRRRLVTPINVDTITAGMRIMVNMMSILRQIDRQTRRDPAL